MTIEILDGKAVWESLSMTDCIRLMQDAAVAHHQQQVILPQRLALPLFNANDTLMMMPGAQQHPAIAGVKTLMICPDNPQAAKPAIQGLITLFDLSSGAPLALIDAPSITAIRTAAASAAATRVLAREQASSLTLIGTGLQAETHLQSIMAVRPITQVKVWSRTRENAAAFAQNNSAQYALPITPVDTIEAAVNNADIICTLTASHQPLIKGQWLKPGVHLNVVGAHTSQSREVDTETIKRSRLFVDLKSAALKEAGDILIPLKEKAISDSHILGDIAQVFLEQIPGRVSEKDITVYKSLGNAAQDLAAAYQALVQAREKGVAKTIEFLGASQLIHHN